MDISVNSVANVVAIPKRVTNTTKSEPEERSVVQDTAPFVSAADIKNKVAKTSAEDSDLSNGQQEKSKERIDSALKNINNFFQMSKRMMQFSVSENTGKVVVEIKDEKTGEVIRQIPSEEVLELEKKLDEVQGLLFSKKA